MNFLSYSFRWCLLSYSLSQLAPHSILLLKNVYKTHPISQSVCVLLVAKLYCYQLWWLFQRRQWHPIPVLLPGKSHGRRSLVGYSPCGREESDTTEQLQFHFPLSCIGEGNGNPLQCSCLENPRERGAWWAAVYVVTQSRTQLKWLSSSSNSIELLRLWW